MTYPQLLAAAVAAVVLVWPLLRQAAVWLAARRLSVPRPAAPAAVKPCYTAAMDDLQSVRLRLLRTGCLQQDQRNAIDVITLALVDGSDQ